MASKFYTSGFRLSPIIPWEVSIIPPPLDSLTLPLPPSVAGVGYICLQVSLGIPIHCTTDRNQLE